MMNEILSINNVHGYLDETGAAWLNAEDVARGFGFTRVATSGNIVVRWERVNKYLSEFGFVPTNGHAVSATDFIPENMVYRLGFKANNETAQKFQAILADDILPTIRKTGMYLAKQEQKRYIAREAARIARRNLTDIIRDEVPDSPHKKFKYKHYTDLAYKAALGYNAKQLRQMKNLDGDANVREYLNADELKAVTEVEDLIKSLIRLGWEYPAVKEFIRNQYLKRIA